MRDPIRLFLAAAPRSDALAFPTPFALARTRGVLAPIAAKALD